MNANHDISKKATLSRGYWQLEYEAKPQKPKPPRKAQRAFWDFHDGRDILSDDDEGSLEGLAEKTSGPTERPRPPRKAQRAFWNFDDGRDILSDDDEESLEGLAAKTSGPTEVSLLDLVVPKKCISRKRKSRETKIFEDYRPVLNEEVEKVELSTDEEEEEEVFAEPTVVNVEPLPRTDQFEIDILGIQSLPTIPPVFSTTNIAGDLVIIRDGGFFLNPKGLEIMAETRKKDVVVEETIFREMDTVHSEIPKVLTQACAEKFALELITKETEAQTSSDTVAPMSQAEKECEICLEEGFQMALASCGHFSCVDCWANYAARAVQDSRVPLRCIGEKCLEVVPISVILIPLRCIGEKCLEVVPISVILSFLRQELVHRYEKQMANRRLLQADFLLCKRCERFLFTTTSSKALLICDCGAAWCRGCREEAHEPLSCENMRRYEDMLRRSGQSFRNVALGHVATGVRCPRCSGLIERTHGCNHMECLCGFAFCYACRGPFAGSHYNCEADAREEYALIDGEDTVHRSVFQKCFQLRQKKNPVQVLGWRRRLEKAASKETAKKLVDRFLQLLEFLERALVHRFFCYRRVHFNQGHLLAQQFSSLEERLHFLLGRVREEQDVSKIEALLGSALRICDNLNERCQRM
uniref:RBR-type E3 ubiquitin transferase n=1 Tax=Steinernema glaseri TaxID=37863 RepID=A0A1I8AM94_9BILA